MAVIGLSNETLDLATHLLVSSLNLHSFTDLSRDAVKRPSSHVHSARTCCMQAVQSGCLVAVLGAPLRCIKHRFLQLANTLSTVAVHIDRLPTDLAFWEVLKGAMY